MEGFLISLGGEWMASGPLHAGWGCLPHRLLHHRPSKLWEGLWTKDPAPQGPADGRHSYHFGWQQKWLSAVPRSVRVRWEGVRSWALPLHAHTGPQAGSLPFPPARLQPGAGGGDAPWSFVSKTPMVPNICSSHLVFSSSSSGLPEGFQAPHCPLGVLLELL